MKQFTQKYRDITENKPGNKERTMDAFAESKVPFSIIAFQTEDEVMDSLFKKNRVTDCAQVPIPQAIMIDVNPAGWNGFHLLKEIHADDESGDIPVIILSRAVL